MKAAHQHTSGAGFLEGVQVEPLTPSLLSSVLLEPLSGSQQPCVANRLATSG